MIAHIQSNDSIDLLLKVDTVNKKVLNRLIQDYSIEVIESELFLRYLSKQGVDYSASNILSSYFSMFDLGKIPAEFLDLLKIHSFADLENALELLIPETDRALNGAFFTPTRIVDEIISELSPREKDKCLDPSCGSGAFLIGFLRYYEAKSTRSIKEVVSQNLHGADILGYNVRRTKLLIAVYALERGEVIEDADFNIVCQDSLRSDWSKCFQVVAGNPPYVKFQDLSKENRQFLLNWETINKGTFNLYFAFFELGYSLLTEDGRLGFITPNNYFTSLAGESLRAYFHRTRSISRVIDFNHYKIFDAQTYTCLTFIDKKSHDYIKYSKMLDSDLNMFLDSDYISAVQIDDLNVKKWRLLRDSEQENIRLLETTGTKLKDLFVINVGIATLKDSLFFVDIDDDGRCFAAYENVRYEVEKEITNSIYKISDFSNQKECNSNSRRIIFPYMRMGGKATILQPEQLAQNYPKCRRYFDVIREELATRGKVELSPFYQYGRSQGLNKTGIRLLTPTFSKYPKFLLVRENDSLYCNGYGLHYKVDFKNGKTLFDNSPIQDKRNIGTLQRVLNSYVMHYYVFHTSVSIQGGYPCYQKNFIELFSVPDFTQGELDQIRKMSEIELDECLIARYELQGLVPNLAWYAERRFGTKELKVKLEIEAELPADKNPSAFKSASVS